MLVQSSALTEIQALSSFFSSKTVLASIVFPFFQLFKTSLG